VSRDGWGWIVDIDVSGLLFDDENERKLLAHGITVVEVQEVYDLAPRFYTNLPGRRASHAMLGPTFNGRLILVPIEEVSEGLWRPVTGFEPRAAQAARYREE
jgi:hypothetical protein